METYTMPKGYGARGWCLIIYQMIGYLVYNAFTSFPTNVMSDQLGGTMVTTGTSLVGSLIGWVVNYFIIAPRIGRIKSYKRVSLILGIPAFLCCVAMCIIPPSMTLLWCAVFVCVNQLTTMWGCSFTTYIIGNWFPRKKGQVMGVVTCSFPVVQGALLGIFSSQYYSTLASTQGDAVATNLICFAPYFIVWILGWILCAIFIKDYPEQCGCFRDNDKSFTKEMADAMLVKEIENRKRSVWKRSKMWGCGHLYLLNISTGILLNTAIAMMVQIIPILIRYNNELSIFVVPGFSLMSQGFTAVLFGLTFFAIFGSLFLGWIDDRFGVRTAILITGIIQVIAGVMGAIDNPWTAVAATWLLGIYMGASSNFGLSSIVRYWRAEDFPSVMTGAPPIGLILFTPQSFIISAIGTNVGYSAAFLYIAALGVVSIICQLCFNPKKIVEYDNKLRAEAGLPLDGLLEERLDREKKMAEMRKAAKAGK
ncbi:MAG: MFS transporter [Parasporobacterium sp.]|nr:MFS transporter [Parasporobacterium sp.]